MCVTPFTSSSRSIGARRGRAGRVAPRTPRRRGTATASRTSSPCRRWRCARGAAHPGGSSDGPGSGLTADCCSSPPPCCGGGGTRAPLCCWSTEEGKWRKRVI